MRMNVRSRKELYNRPVLFNTNETLDLPLGKDLESLYFYVYGNINVTTAFGGVRSEGLAKLFEYVEVWSQGKRIATVPFSILSHGNFMRGTAPLKINPGTAVGNYLGVEIGGYLDFVSIKSVRAKDSILAAHKSGTLEVRWKVGNINDVLINAAAPAAPGVAAATLQMSISLDAEDEEPFATLPNYLHIHDKLEKSYPASINELIPIKPQGLIRAIVLRVETNGELDANALKRIKFSAGGIDRLDIPAAVCYDMNTSDNNYALPPGYYVLDFARQPSGLEKYTDFLDSDNLQDVSITLDVTGSPTTKIQMLTHRFVQIDQHVIANAHAQATA